MGLIEDRYSILYKDAMEMERTCSILYPEDNCFTFARDRRYINKLIGVDLNLVVAVPKKFLDRSMVRDFSDKIKFHYIDDEDSVEYVWVYIHNKIHEHTTPRPVIIGEDCDISEHAIIGITGNSYAKTPEGTRLHLKEIGGVRIGDRVTIAAHSIVHRSCFEDTIVEDDVIVCVKCNIGHNTKVGARTYIAPGVLLGGGTQIGADCFIWQAVVTHSQIKICDKVMVGNKSYVHRDITESGIYAGSPAKYIKPFDEAVLKGEVQW